MNNMNTQVKNTFQQVGADIRQTQHKQDRLENQFEQWCQHVEEKHLAQRQQLANHYIKIASLKTEIAKLKYEHEDLRNILWLVLVFAVISFVINVGVLCGQL